MFVVVNVLVIVQIRINSHQPILQISEIVTVVLNVIAVALVKCAFRQYIGRQYDMIVDVLNHSGQSKRTNYSSHCRRNLFQFKCPVLNFVNFSCVTPATTSAVRTYDCWSPKSFIIPNDEQIFSHRTNILSLSTILFPVSTERQLVNVFCKEHRKDFVTHNINMNNIAVGAADAMVKYSNNNTIYNLNLFISNDNNNNNNYYYYYCHHLNIFTILYLANYDFTVILNLINFYVDFSVKSYYGTLIFRNLFHNFIRRIYKNFNVKCWSHKMRPALKNSMIFALWY